jgi:hypothetical protein
MPIIFIMAQIFRNSVKHGCIDDSYFAFAVWCHSGGMVDVIFSNIPQLIRESCQVMMT